MKQTLLGVPDAILAQHGAVSEPTVLAMAHGALSAARLARLSVAVSGIAGPGGGSAAKPVAGLVRRGGQEKRHGKSGKTGFSGLTGANPPAGGALCSDYGGRLSFRDALNWNTNALCRVAGAW